MDAIPIIFGLSLHLETRYVGYIVATVATNDIASVIANKAILIPLTRILFIIFKRGWFLLDVVLVLNFF